MTRLEWTEYFSKICELVSQRSPCERLKVGCVIVKDKRIVATGYNGFLPGGNHVSVVRDNHEQATVHAEQNCIADCAKRGVSVEGGTAFITHYPCIICFKILVSSGIKEIYYLQDYKNDEVIQVINKDINIVLEKI